MSDRGRLSTPGSSLVPDGKTAPPGGVSDTRCDECRCFLEDCRCGEYDDRDEYDCTICGGDGTCMDNSDPLWDCDDLPHACHSCRGTGRRSDQRYM